MSIHSTGIGRDQPLVVSPRRAMMLLDIGNTKLYELIDDGVLESVTIGRSRKIKMQSILRLINQSEAA